MYHDDLVEQWQKAMDSLLTYVSVDLRPLNRELTIKYC